MDFTDDERETFYRLIAARRDIRRFRPDPVPEDALSRILWAAHHAGYREYAVTVASRKTLIKAPSSWGDLELHRLTRRGKGLRAGPSATRSIP